MGMAIQGKSEPLERAADEGGGDRESAREGARGPAASTLARGRARARGRPADGPRTRARCRGPRGTSAGRAGPAGRSSSRGSAPRERNRSRSRSTSGAEPEPGDERPQLRAAQPERPRHPPQRAPVLRERRRAGARARWPPPPRAARAVRAGHPARAAVGSPLAPGVALGERPEQRDAVAVLAERASPAWRGPPVPPVTRAARAAPRPG